MSICKFRVVIFSPLQIEDKSWRIDFGKLLRSVTHGNIAEIKKAVLFGSKPPHNDTLWNAMQKAQFEVIALDSNVAGKQKAVDTGIITRIDKFLYKEASAGDTFILVMGDKDFVPASAGCFLCACQNMPILIPYLHLLVSFFIF